MKKTAFSVATRALFLSFGGCSTYNSVAPDWAKIGSSDSENEVVVTESSGDTESSTWWNPFTWW